MTGPFDLNLRHLRAVAAIARSGRLGAAAREESLSQPALTQGLARLESAMGTALFDRQPGGMRPTAAGAIVAARGAEAMAQLATAMRGGSGTRARGFSMPERLLTTAQLRAFLALAEAGSYAGAAAATGIAQPSIHRAVRDVERLAGVPLVERRGRGLALTERGRRAARGFRLAARAIEACLTEIAVARGADAGTLVIGAMPLARARLLPEALAALCRRHARARVTVVEGGHRDLVDMLRDGRVDLIIGALREPIADLDQVPLCADRLAVIVRQGHPLLDAGPVGAAELARYPWIVGLPGAPVRALWRRLFDEARVAPPEAPIECGSVMTIRGMLLAGDYVTLLSPDQVWVELDAGLLRRLEGAAVPAPRTIGYSTRAEWRPTALEAEFLALLHAAGERLSENLSLRP